MLPAVKSHPPKDASQGPAFVSLVSKEKVVLPDATNIGSQPINPMSPLDFGSQVQSIPTIP